MNYEDCNEMREYERRIKECKNRDYTEDELREWQLWAEKWVEQE